MSQYVTSEHETLEFGRLILQHFRVTKNKKNWLLSMSALLLQNYTLSIDLYPLTGLTVKKWSCNVSVLYVNYPIKHAENSRKTDHA